MWVIQAMGCLNTSMFKGVGVTVYPIVFMPLSAWLLPGFVRLFFKSFSSCPAPAGRNDFAPQPSKPMKTAPRFRIVSFGLTLCVALLLTQPARADTANANEFWISPNPDTQNLGTLADPFDGSTREKFDAAMNRLPPNSVIHLLAGTYQTYGNCGFTLKSGTQVLGSGIDVTVLQFPEGTPDNTTMIASTGQGGSTSTTNITISDLTCDCNYQSGSYTYHGIILEGTRHTIRRVKLTHPAKMSASNSEAWGLMIANYTLPYSEGNLIENCEVSGYEHALPGANLNAVGLCGDFIRSISGIIRNNTIIGTHARTSMVYGILCGSDCLVEGNYVEGAQEGCYGEASLTNVMFVNNVLKNCTVGVDMENSSGYRNLTFAFNQVILTNAVWPFARAFSFAAVSPATFTNIFIFGNTVSYVGSDANPNRFFVDAHNVSGLVVANNTVDSSFTNHISNCANVSLYGNSDLFGNYRPDLNIPTLGATPVTDFGLQLISSAGYTPALVTLGLPANPLMILTNGSTQPVNFNTNVTVGANLTVNTLTAGDTILSRQTTYANPVGYPDEEWSMIASRPGIHYLALVANDANGYLTGQRSSGPGTGHRSLAFMTFSDTNDVSHQLAQYVFDTAAGSASWFPDQVYWSWQIGGEEKAYIDTNASWTLAAPRFSVAGDIMARRFYGDGGNLTNLNGTQLAGGVLTNNQGGVTLNGTFSGNGAGLTNLNPASLGTGTAGISISGNAATATTAANVTGAIADAQLPAGLARMSGANSFTGTNRFAGVTVATNGNNVFGGTFIGDGSRLTGMVVTNGSADTGVQLSQLSLPANMTVYGSNGVAAAAFLGPQLAFRSYTNAAGGATNTGPTLLLNSFTSPEFSIRAGLMADLAHGFSNTPTFVRWVVVCKTNDVGYSAGDECDADYVLDNKGTSVFAEGSNATNIFLIYKNGSSLFYLANKGSGAIQSGTIVRWKAKAYARP